MSYQNTLKTLSSKTENFKNSIYPYCVTEWNKLNLTLNKAESLKFKTLIKNS